MNDILDGKLAFDICVRVLMRNLKRMLLETAAMFRKNMMGRNTKQNKIPVGIHAVSNLRNKLKTVLKVEKLLKKITSM